MIQFSEQEGEQRHSSCLSVPGYYSIIPSITGWSSINYWQALGLAVLFRLLTGHLSPHMFHQRGKNHFHEKMRGMPISERKAFIRRQLSKLTKEDTNNE